MKPLLTLSSCLALSTSALAQVEMSQFWPLQPGYSWTGIDPVACSDPCGCSGATYFDVQSQVSAGRYLVGPSPVDVYDLENDGSALTIHGGLDGGMPWTPFQGPVVMGSVPDGTSFQFEDDIWLMVRDWDAITHPDKDLYGIDSCAGDVAVWVWYDLDCPDPMNPCPASTHNALMESGLPPGTAPGGAVTDIDWFVRGIGPSAYMDVDSASGQPWPPVLGVRYFAALDCNGNGVLDRNDPDANGNCIPDDCECVSFCTSLPNATGSPASLTCSGSPTAGLVLTSSPVPNTPGLFFFGTMMLQGSPFGDGLRCVGGATTRMFPFVQAGMMMQAPNSAALAVDYAAPYACGLTGTRYFQHWFRSGLATGAGFNTSDAVAVTF